MKKKKSHTKVHAINNIFQVVFFIVFFPFLLKRAKKKLCVLWQIFSLPCFITFSFFLLFNAQSQSLSILCQTGPVNNIGYMWMCPCVCKTADCTISFWLRQNNNKKLHICIPKKVNRENLLFIVARITWFSFLFSGFVFSPALFGYITIKYENEPFAREKRTKKKKLWRRRWEICIVQFQWMLSAIRTVLFGTFCVSSLEQSDIFGFGSKRFEKPNTHFLTFRSVAKLPREIVVFSSVFFSQTFETFFVARFLRNCAFKRLKLHEFCLLWYSEHSMCCVYVTDMVISMELAN